MNLLDKDDEQDWRLLQLETKVVILQILVFVLVVGLVFVLAFFLYALKRHTTSKKRDLVTSESGEAEPMVVHNDQPLVSATMQPGHAVNTIETTTENRPDETHTAPTLPQITPVVAAAAAADTVVTVEDESTSRTREMQAISSGASSVSTNRKMRSRLFGVSSVSMSARSTSSYALTTSSQPSSQASVEREINVRQ